MKRVKVWVKTKEFKRNAFSAEYGELIKAGPEDSMVKLDSGEVIVEKNFRIEEESYD